MVHKTNGVVRIEDINRLYRNNLLITGFLKSTIGTSMISLGFGIILLWAYTPNSPDHTPLVGILGVVIGFLVYYAGDLYNISQNRLIEQKRLEKASDIIDEKIKAEKERIAQEVIDRAERKKLAIDSDVAKKLDEIQRGICSDLNKMTDEELEYCGQIDNKKILSSISYPDTISPQEIIQIAIEKFKGRNAKITIDLLKQYCNDLNDVGLISDNKLTECLDYMDKKV